MPCGPVNPCFDLSLPSRERGLKSRTKVEVLPESSVAPLAGARIEITAQKSYIRTDSCRSPRGSED